MTDESLDVSLPSQAVASSSPSRAVGISDDVGCEHTRSPNPRHVRCLLRSSDAMQDSLVMHNLWAAERTGQWFLDDRRLSLTSVAEAPDWTKDRPAALRQFGPSVPGSRVPSNPLVGYPRALSVDTVSPAALEEQLMLKCINLEEQLKCANSRHAPPVGRSMSLESPAALEAQLKLKYANNHSYLTDASFASSEEGSTAGGSSVSLNREDCNHEVAASESTEQDPWITLTAVVAASRDASTDSSMDASISPVITTSEDLSADSINVSYIEAAPGLDWSILEHSSETIMPTYCDAVVVDVHGDTAELDNEIEDMMSLAEETLLWKAMAQMAASSNRPAKHQISKAMADGVRL